MDYNNTHTKTTAAKSGKVVKLPICIPVALYNAVKMSCTKLVLSNDPNNTANINSDPMIRLIAGKEIVLYSAGLLLTWLRYLVRYTLWGRKVQVIKVKKSAVGTGRTRTEEEYVDEAVVLHLPTDEEIQAATAPGTASIMSANEMVDLRAILGTVLLRPTGNDEYDLITTDYSVGNICYVNRVTTPNAIARTERLANLNMQTVSLSEEDKIRWDDYLYREGVRMEMVVKDKMKAAVSTADLEKMSMNDRQSHNLSVVTALSEQLNLEPGTTPVYQSNYQAVIPVGTINKMMQSHARVKSSASSVKKPTQQEWKYLADQILIHLGVKIDIASLKGKESVVNYQRKQQELADCLSIKNQHGQYVLFSYDGYTKNITYRFLDSPQMGAMQQAQPMQYNQSPYQSSYQTPYQTPYQAPYQPAPFRPPVYGNQPMPTSMYSQDQQPYNPIGVASQQSSSKMYPSSQAQYSMRMSNPPLPPNNNVPVNNQGSPVLPVSGLALTSTAKPQGGPQLLNTSGVAPKPLAPFQGSISATGAPTSTTRFGVSNNTATTGSGAHSASPSVLTPQPFASAQPTLTVQSNTTGFSAMPQSNKTTGRFVPTPSTLPTSSYNLNPPIVGTGAPVSNYSHVTQPGPGYSNNSFGAMPQAFNRNFNSNEEHDEDDDEGGFNPGDDDDDEESYGLTNPNVNKQPAKVEYRASGTTQPLGTTTSANSQAPIKHDVNKVEETKQHTAVQQEDTKSQQEEVSTEKDQQEKNEDDRDEKEDAEEEQQDKE